MLEFSWSGVLSAAAAPGISVFGVLFVQLLGTIGVIVCTPAIVAYALTRDIAETILLTFVTALLYTLIFGLMIALGWYVSKQGSAGVSTTFYMIGWTFWFVGVPTALAAAAFALLDRDVRREVMGDVLVDVDALSPEDLAPIKPYLDNFKRRPGWRRSFRLYSLEWEFRVPPGRWVTQRDLTAMYRRHRQLLAANTRACREESAALDAQDIRDLAAARTSLIHFMSDEERGLLEMRLQVSVDAHTRRKLEEKDHEIGRLKQHAAEAAQRLAANEAVITSQRRLLLSYMDFDARGSDANLAAPILNGDTDGRCE